MAMASNMTTIQVEKETKMALDRYGRKGETYDDIIKRLLKSHEYVTFMEGQHEILDKEKDWTPLEDF